MLFFSRKPKINTKVPKVEFSVGEITILVRRLATARRLSLRVKSVDSAILTAPPRVSLREIKAFTESQKEWIEAAAARVGAAANPFAPDARIDVAGSPLLLVHRPEGRGVKRVDDRLEVGGGIEHFGRRVTDYLKKLARETLSERTRVYAQLAGVTVKQVSVRDTRSRWGSCSAKGAISYSWRLILAPPAVLDYVAAHEVAHRLEMNHSPRFWAVVERLYPDYGPPQRWLKTQGSSLHRYG
ncbi:M48 family metallopeptidase [Lacibacterium aquatile]|uniref:M48 family metallopeptidase n=1 Tax=Lacibacterium aquatile TaxID=1168082 RepID=A0ABW5DWU2_9PROT